VNRDIFIYSDGIKKKAGDPIQLYINLERSGLDWDELERLEKEFNETGKPDYNSLERVTGQLYETFGLFPLEITEEEDERGDPITKGVTISELLGVFYKFISFMSELKKTDESTQTSQQSTEQESSSMSEKTSPTSTSADSTSTSTEDSSSEVSKLVPA
jgi:hypothetical protein